MTKLYYLGDENEKICLKIQRGKESIMLKPHSYLFVIIKSSPHLWDLTHPASANKRAGKDFQSHTGTFPTIGLAVYSFAIWAGLQERLSSNAAITSARTTRIPVSPIQIFCEGF
jgi:hypothetical protein